MSATYPPLIDSFTRRCARGKASRLARQHGFSASDQLDLEQSLVLRVLECLPSFDERKGHRNAFIATIVERHAFTIVRDRNVRKRDTRRVSSLNVTINLPNEGLTELGQTLGERETETRLGVRRRSDQAATEVAQDIAAVIASLPEPLKDLAERLKHQTISEISRDLGISRSTLNHRLVRLRQRFEEMGMREYLAT